LSTTDAPTSPISSLPETDSETSGNIPGRTIKGTFVTGQSGNPKGRPKGSRNAITLTRLATEAELRAFFKPHARKVLRRAVEIALTGDPAAPATVAMIRTLLDKSMSSLRNEDVGDEKDQTVVVNFNRLTVQKLPQPIQDAIDAEVLPPSNSNSTEDK
jgi:hypothetical protein